MRDTHELGVSSYWDNVGGQTLEVALDMSHRYARFIVSRPVALAIDEELTVMVHW